MQIPQRYIAIDGVPGVGKSTLLALLADKLDATSVREDAGGNPFLDNFYRDMKGYAFQTQMFYLLSRYRQQQELAQPDLFTRVVLSDYHFGKDRIFALLTLSDAELALYENLYGLLLPQVPAPDLVIYLQADAATVAERLAHSMDEMHARVSREYVGILIDAYNHYFFHYNATPLLVVNSNAVDFSHQPEELDALVRQISECASGSRCYSPRTGGGSGHGQGSLLP